MKQQHSTRIEVITHTGDARGAAFQTQLTGASVSVVDVYTLTIPLTSSQKEAAVRLLHNPIVQQALYDRPVGTQPVEWAVEIGYLPGVTDNIGTTARETLIDGLHLTLSDTQTVYSSRLLLIHDPVPRATVQTFAATLYNPLIQRISLQNGAGYRKGAHVLPVPEVHLAEQQEVTNVSLRVPDEELRRIGKEGIPNPDGSRRGPLALDLASMKTIQAYFTELGRDPTDIELESIAQTWSEHCKHTIFADPIDEIEDGLFRHYIKRATRDVMQARTAQGETQPFCVSVFTDNAGAISFDDEYLVTDKVETHNTPSALDPFGGAITGIVGVNRDALGFGLGAKPVINRYGFCFATPDLERPLYRDAGLTMPMLSPRRIMDGVIAGVNEGGNCSGIPTPQGFMLFDDRYQGKPLVFVGTVGLIPRTLPPDQRLSHQKQARPGDYIVMVGGRVGLDGIHGATFSSEGLDEGSPATAVQIGDPITQKKLSDALIKEARDRGLYTSITDNGAGGLSCSVAEMAKESGGFVVQLERIPLKYPGLSPWQIWISESQERMTLAVLPEHWEELHSLLAARGVEATVIGTFTDSGRCVVEHHERIILDMSMEFLHDGLPSRPLETDTVVSTAPEPRLPMQESYTDDLLRLLQRYSLSSTEFVSQQYDHEVQAGSVLKPLQGRGRVNAEVTITRPLLTAQKGVGLSQGLYPRYSDIDTYHMAASSLDTAIRNLVAAGIHPDKIALLDNFCWCSANEPERLYQLKQAVEACYDYAVAYNAPYISGKDSMFNDFTGYSAEGHPVKISVPPTLLISSIGIIDDVSQAISIDTKFADDLVYVLGATDDELGGSEYYAMKGFVGASVPCVDAEINRELYRRYHLAVQQQIIASAISVTRGGLAIAFAKMAMAGKQGLQLELDAIPGSWSSYHHLLFSESQGRIVVTVAPQHKAQFETIMADQSIACIGTVSRTSRVALLGTRHQQQLPVIDTSVEHLLKTYRSRFAQPL